MLKTNPAMLDMFKSKLPADVDNQTIIKGLEWLAAIAKYYI